MKIGIIGLGLMGLNMAKNLLNKGYDVVGYDVNFDRCDLLKTENGKSVGSCAEVGSETSTVILMVFSPDNLREALFGDGSLSETLKMGDTVIVTASVGKHVIEEAAARLAEQGINLLDATLMASCDDAAAGTMHIIVSGAQKVIKAQHKLLQDMSCEIYFAGDAPGMAQVAKSCLQTLFGLTFEMAFETITLAEKSGVNISELRRLFNDSPSSCPLLHISQKNVIDRVFLNTNNPLSIMDKDIQLALDLAKELGIEMPAAEGTAKVFRDAMELFPDEDIWAAAKVLVHDAE